MSEKLCPIPGCGGVGENLTSDTSKDTKCTKCGFLCRHDFWQSLPRASESVLEVTREIRKLYAGLLRDFSCGHLASNQPGKNIEHYSKAMEKFASRLEAAAPGMGTPGEVFVAMPDSFHGDNFELFANECDADKYIKEHGIPGNHHVYKEEVHGTLQPKAEVGEMHVVIRNQPAHTPGMRPKDYSPLAGAFPNKKAALKWAREQTDEHKFSVMPAIHCVPVIGAPSRGECTCDDIGDGPCPTHARECALQDRAISAENDLAEAQQENKKLKKWGDRCCKEEGLAKDAVHYQSNKVDEAHVELEAARSLQETTSKANRELIAERDTALAGERKARKDATDLGQLYKEADVEHDALREQMEAAESERGISVKITDTAQNPEVDRLLPPALSLVDEALGREQAALAHIRLLEKDRGADELPQELVELESERHRLAVENEFLQKLNKGSLGAFKKIKAQRDTALAGEAKARKENEHLRKHTVTTERKNHELEAELSTLREQLEAANSRAQTINTARNVLLEKHDALRKQLGEVERVRDKLEGALRLANQNTKRRGDQRDALAERVRELEEAQHCHACSAGPESGRDFYCTDCANVDYSYDVPPTTAEGEKATCPECGYLFRPGDGRHITPDGRWFCLDHAPPPDPSPPLPVCPKCGKAPTVGKRFVWCDKCEGVGGISMQHTPDEWLRHCAENTKCVKCKNLPVTGPMDALFCGNSTCPTKGPHTPAEWLASNPTKESGDD